MQVVNWGLILLVVGVLTISEARANECRHESEEFCHHTNAAHGKNEENLKDMAADLSGNGKKALALADKFVVAVLNAEEQQLLPALKKALKAELSALVQVKAECFKLFKSYNEKCEKIYSNIGYALADLIQAIIDVHPDGEKKDKIETIFSTLDVDIFKKPTLNYANTAHALGKQILMIM